MRIDTCVKLTEIIIYIYGYIFLIHHQEQRRFICKLWKELTFVCILISYIYRNEERKHDEMAAAAEHGTDWWRPQNRPSTKRKRHTFVIG